MFDEMFVQKTKFEIRLDGYIIWFMLPVYALLTLLVILAIPFLNKFQSPSLLQLLRFGGEFVAVGVGVEWATSFAETST